MSSENDRASVDNSESPEGLSYAYFSLTSESLSLGEISALVGVETVRGWSIGEPFRRKHSTRALVRGFSRWECESGAPPGAPIREHLDALFPLVSAIAGPLGATRDIRPSLQIVQYLYNDGEVGFHLGPEWLTLLSSIAGSIDIDQYLD